MDTFFQDRKIKECCSTGTTHRIISDVLGYNKVCVRWVPRMLTDEIKRIQMQTSNHDIKLYKADLPNFFVDM